MKKVMTLLMTIATTSVFATTPIQFNGSQAREMAKVLKLVGANEKAISGTITQYSIGKLVCDEVRINVGSLPSYSCDTYSPAPTKGLQNEIASMLISKLLEKAGVYGEGHMGHYTYDVNFINCTIDTDTDESSCTISPEFDAV